MSLPFIAAFRTWTNRRKNLLRGVVGVAVQTAASFVPVVGGLAGNLLGELAAHGVERLADIRTNLPEVKPAGEALGSDELEQINNWLESLANSYGELLDLLEKRLPESKETEGLEKITERIEKALESDDQLASKFDKCLKRVRKQTLSLRRIERKLDEHFHVHQEFRASLEEIKSLFIDLPSLAEWAELRRLRPEAIDAVRRADEHFLAGRPEQGVKVLLDLLAQRGVGEATLLRHLGASAAAFGALPQVAATMRRSPAGDTSLARTLLGLTARSTRGGGRLKVWRSLPRGLRIQSAYEIEEEIGRGGMASVYKAKGVGLMTRKKTFAIKVPASELLQDEQSVARFVQEVELTQHFSGAGHHPAIVQMLGHVVFPDPDDHSDRLGLVLEYIDGMSLAQYLDLRRAQGQPLRPEEIAHVMEGVCAALMHAHNQRPVVLHRDVKPHNVMLSGGPEAPMAQRQVKLMDFGIARILDENADDLTLTGQALGTPGYMPFEFMAEKPWATERSDVYLLASLLRQLLTFHPYGNVLQLRKDCPETWKALLNRSQCPLEDERLPSVKAFHDMLADGLREHQARAAGQEAQFRHQRAQKMEEAHDYAAAVSELEKLPAEWRSAPPDQLPPERRDIEIARLALVHKRDRVTGLEQHVRALEEARQFDARLRGALEEWLALQPNRKDLQEQRDKLPREWTNSLGMKLAIIPPGTFLMGSPETEEGREAHEQQHQVEITRPFFLGIHPVTQAQYQRVMGSNPSHFSGNPNNPVELVTWDEAVAFCKKLSEMAEEKRAKRVYTLPTEAQWEYSCRGGDSSNPFHFGGSLSSTQANFEGNHPYGGAAKGPSLQRTCPVGSYPSNAFGLFDMHGNVWEWCADWFDENYYNQSPRHNPQGPQNGQSRVLRGGAWLNYAAYCRAAYRNWNDPGFRNGSIGFRVLFSA